MTGVISEMANTIRIKRSTGSSAPGQLENAELAHAEGSDIIFIGKGTGGSGGSATTIEKIGGKGAFWDKDTVRAANSVLSGPTTGSDAAPTFRALVANDIPTLTAIKISNFNAAVQSNLLNQLAAPTGSVSLNNQTITNLADPVNTQDAATKGFVEATSQGLDVKDSCKAATTGNITISTALNNGDTLDGVTLATNDRVLVKDQSTASQNGIYIVGSSPARASDLAAGSDAAGMFTFVEQGTVNADNGFVCTSNKGSAVTGTNNLTFAQFSGAGQVIAGNGLDKSGNTLSLDLKSSGGLRFESTELALNLSGTNISGTLAVSDGGTGATSASAARTALGLAIGTNVQAFDQQLSDVAGLTPSDSNFIVGNGSNFVAESGATARASLGVSIGSQVQAYDADLDNLSGMQSGASSALAALTSTEISILDGLNTTTAELNIMDGNTSATSTTLAVADRLVMNDNGTMKQVGLADLVTFLENESVSGFNIDGGTY